MRSDDAFAIRQGDCDARSGDPDRRDPDRRLQHDPFLGQARGEKCHQFGIVARQHRAGVNHCDRGTEPAMRLRQFDADRPAANHDQVRGQGAVGEHRLVGQERHAGKAGDRRHDGRRSGGDDKAARPDHRVAGGYRAGIDEMRLGTEDLHPERRKALCQVVRGDCGDDPRDGVHHRGEIDLRRRNGDPVCGAPMPAICQLRRGEQRFRRHAAVVEAVAAHRAALDEHDACAHLCRPGRNREPGCAGADHAQIGNERGHRGSGCVRPRRRW